MSEELEMSTLKWTLLPALITTCLFTTIVAFGQSAANTSPPAENRGSISGRVTVDGEPKAGVVLELLRAEDSRPNRAPVAKTTTSRTGRYLLRNIASGTYDVLPVAPGVIIPDEESIGRRGKMVSVTAGEALRDLDFRLVSEGRITGRVTGVDGKPVVGETLTLVLTGENNYRREFHSPQLNGLKTDERGAFSISGVPPGKYLVVLGVSFGLASFAQEESKRSAYPRTFYPDATEESKATVVEVKRGSEAAGVDITVGAPLKLYEISGQVVDASTGLGISGVSLGVITRAAGGRMTIDQSGPWVTKTDGRFLIKGAIAGDYSIYPMSDPVSNSYGEPVEFKVEDGDIAGLQLAMRRASSIYGTVIVDGSGGAGAAVMSDNSGLMLYANPLDGNSNAGRSSVRAGADGTFRLSGLRPGKYGLMVMGSSATAGSNGFRILRVERNGTLLPDGIEVNSGEDVAGLTVVVGAGNGLIRGNVKIEGGPLEGVTPYVNCRPVSANGDTGSIGHLDARGHFVIGGLLPGEYELTIGPMHAYVNGGAASRTMARMPTVKQIVNVTPGSETEVTLVMTLRPK